MSPLLIEIIGLIAATLTTLSFLPQTIKIIQTKNTQSISLVMYLAFTSGVLSWLVYGILIISWPIILANAVTLCLAGTILFLKIKFG